MNHMTNSLSSADISIFSSEISKFYYIKNTNIFFDFFWVFKDLFINTNTILMMLTKLATLGLCKTKIFRNRGYDVTILDYEVTNKILSRDSNYIVDLVTSLKFGNSSLSITEVIKNPILYGFNQKNNFFWGVVLVQVQ